MWWAPVLARGRLHIVLLGENFPGEKPAGAAILVAKVRAALNVRFQGSDAPSILFVDKGRGFYNCRWSTITPEFKAALAEHELTVYYGDDASVQPGNLQEVMLHETAVAWIRPREAITKPSRAWEETADEFGARLSGICEDINQHCDVAGLCRKLPERAQAVADAEGGRISA